MPGFLLWARRDAPELYAAMCRDLPEVAAFDRQLDTDGMSGFLDVVKAVGSSLTKSASKIGSYVAKNALPVLTAAVPLVVAKKQVDIAKAQVKLAQAQAAPMQTAIVPGGSGVPVPVQYNAATGTYSAAPGFTLPAQQQGAGVMSSLSRPVLGVPLWGWLAGAGVLAVVMLSRRR